MTKNDYNMLSLKGRTDIIAAAIRFKAARKYAGLGQDELASASSRSVSNISNMERARSFPALEAIMYLWNNHRVDANFIVAGAYSQLPSDVVPSLMVALEEVISTSDLQHGLGKLQKTETQQSL